jgi:hypothetical protein
VEGLAVVIRWDGYDLGLVDLPYNATISNERAVELAVAFHWLHGRTGAGLEVGNVLGHYGVSGHRVVDLHEQAPGVDNMDVFHVDGTYDWAVAISTIEHVRWDVEHDYEAAAAAIEHLLTLTDNLLVTIPLGWNPPLDAVLPLNATKHATYHRHGDAWQLGDIEPVKYGPAWANAVWVGEWS